MSSSHRAALAPLTWACLLRVLSFLDDRDLCAYGCTAQDALVIAQRERGARRCSKAKLDLDRFLHVGDLQDEGRVVLVSYPRSGNSLLRQLLEKRTGLYTGSDNRPNRALALNLIEMGGYFGEGIADESVWVTKSHYPERVGYLPIKATAVVCVVRNPFDAIFSYFHMGMTNTHNQTLSTEVKA